MRRKKIAFVGAGFASAVLARELVDSGLYEATIFESRNHIAGNCYTNREEGIMIHKYGPHIFNTSNKEVWDYVNKFGQFEPFTNRVKAVTDKGIFSLPINLLTLNQFFNKRFTPDEARIFLNSIGDSTVDKPNNFEEQALKMLGEELYKNFFYGYTKKQWGIEPSLLPASILKRLPIRFNYDDNYFQHIYQGIPKDGYTDIISKILNHDFIKVNLNFIFDKKMIQDFEHVFYSGAIDRFFNYEKGELGYRTLEFNKFTYNGDFQGNAVINYCQESTPYTRITEHKHFTPWESHENSICFKEYSKLTTRDTDPYYPLRTKEDMSIFNEYINLANNTLGVTFIGRLGTYRYLDMHIVIEESLNLAKYCKFNEINKWPSFSNTN